MLTSFSFHPTKVPLRLCQPHRRGSGVDTYVSYLIFPQPRHRVSHQHTLFLPISNLTPRRQDSQLIMIFTDEYICPSCEVTTGRKTTRKSAIHPTDHTSVALFHPTLWRYKEFVVYSCHALLCRHVSICLLLAIDCSYPVRIHVRESIVHWTSVIGHWTETISTAHLCSSSQICGRTLRA